MLQVQKCPTFIGSPENHQFFNWYRYTYQTPPKLPVQSLDHRKFSFVRRYGGGLWFATTPEWDINGNPPCSTPITFSLVGMLTDVTFCDTSDTLRMREYNGTAVLKTSVYQYRQLVRGSRNTPSNLWWADKIARNSTLPGDVVSRDGCPILSFGCLQKVCKSVKVSETFTNPSTEYRETFVNSQRCAIALHPMRWTNPTKNA